MATLRVVAPQEIDATLLSPLTLDYGLVGVISVRVRWKTWFGWAHIQYVNHDPLADFKQTDTYRLAVDTAIEDLNNRLRATFNQLQEIIQ